MSKHIVFVDPVGTGHHTFYTLTIMEGLLDKGFHTSFIGDTQLFNRLQAQIRALDGKPVPFSNKGSRVKVEINKLRFLTSTFKNSLIGEADLIHLLYLDWFVLALFVTRLFIRPPMSRVVATLHWSYFMVSSGQNFAYRVKLFLERLCLGFLLKQGLIVVVHSVKIADQLNAYYRTHSFIPVPYPVSITSENNTKVFNDKRKEFYMTDEDKLLLSFGDTRYDKGADLSIQILARLPSNYHLLIAGKADTFDYAFLKRLAEQLGVTGRVHLNLDYIPEEEIRDYFLSADLVLLPYRKEFSGQSGPLTLAASYHKLVVASNSLVIDETVQQYSLGITADSEDIDGMAKAIKECETYNKQPEWARFTEEHNVSTFVKLMINLYQSQKTNA